MSRLAFALGALGWLVALAVVLLGSPNASLAAGVFISAAALMVKAMSPHTRRW